MRYTEEVLNNIRPPLSEEALKKLDEKGTEMKEFYNKFMQNLNEAEAMILVETFAMCICSTFLCCSLSQQAKRIYLTDLLRDLLLQFELLSQRAENTANEN